jgi:outer membrane lipoprotein carrier protein
MHIKSLCDNDEPKQSEMKKLKSSIVMVAMIVVGLMMASAQSEKITDKKAKDILDGAAKKIQAFKTIKIDFTFSDADEGKEGTSRKGRVWLKGSKYQLRFAGQEVFCDGKTKWTYIKDAEEVHITNVKDDDDELANPINLLKNYQRRFSGRWIKEETYKGKKIDVVDLYPKKKKGYHRVRLRIEKSTLQIVSTSVYHVNNTSQTIDVDKFVTNEAISDDYFKWDAKKHPNVEEIDLRK